MISSGAALAVGISLAALGAAGGDALPVADEAMMTNYLARTYSEPRGTSNENVRILAVDEAVAAVDKVFAKVPDRISADGLARMKRLLKENLAFVYSYDATVVGKSLDCYVKGKREKLPVGTSFSAVAYRERLFEGGLEPILSLERTASIHPRRCSGWTAWVFKPGGEVFNLDHVSNDETGILPFRVRRLETSVSTGVWEKAECHRLEGGEFKKVWQMRRKQRDDVEVALIADIEDVSFNSLESLNHTHVVGNSNGYRPATPVATYRVELIVRKVEEGIVDFDRIAFVVDPRQHENFLYDYGTGWPFFRGLTVRVQLCREGNTLQVVSARPVSPSPPYEDAMRIPEDGGSSRFALNPKAMARPKGAVATEYLQYGDHTLAKFYSMSNDITGSFGNFPDYSRTVRVEVWTASEGADTEYWRTAWFNRDLTNARKSNVTVQNVEDGMDAETRVAFVWYDFGFNHDLSSIKTLGAFADLVNERVVCKICARPHYRLMVPEELRTRAVRFDDEAYGRVLDLLDGVCERTGCVRTLRGQEVVLVSEVSDVELSDKSLRGRLSILEKDGFASVMGAEYVKFSSFGLKSRNDWESPYYCPYTFWSDTAYVTTGNGWRRKDADGNEEYLVYDADWWTAEEWKRRGYGFSPYEAKTRLARDAAKVRSALLDAAEAPDDRVAARLSRPEIDAFALAFALHLQQFGREDDAQSIYDALRLRPAAAEAAFAKLRQRVKLGRRQKGR